MITNNLKVILAKKRVKVIDLAKGTGIAKSTLSRINQNHNTAVRYATVEKICDYLEITPTELFNYEPEKKGDNDVN